MRVIEKDKKPNNLDYRTEKFGIKLEEHPLLIGEGDMQAPGRGKKT